MKQKEEGKVKDCSQSVKPKILEYLKDLGKPRGEASLEGKMMHCIEFKVTSRQQNINIQMPVMNKSLEKKLELR